MKNDWNILPEDEQAEIIKRRAICSVCPFNSELAKDNGYVTERIDNHCIMCGCTISRKTASLSSECGIACCNMNNQTNCDCKKKTLKEYNIKNGIDMPIKWGVYKKKDDE